MRNRDARSTALAVLDAVARTDTLVTAALRREAEKYDLPSEVTGLANELVLGVFRTRSLLDETLAQAMSRGLPKGDRRLLDVLRMATYELLFLDSVPDYATVSAFVNLARATKGPQIGGFVNAVLRKVASQPREQVLAEWATARPDIRFSMPEWLLEHVHAAFGENWQVEAALLNKPAPIGLHVNPRRTKAADLIAELADSGVEAALVPGLPNALRVNYKTAPYQTPAFVQGKFWPQDLASQLVAHLAALAPEGRWWDACCGVGTKTLALSATAPASRLAASDASATRVENLARRVESLGLGPVSSQPMDLLEGILPGDDHRLVLVDAPCSGLGTLRHHPELRWRRKPEDVERNARLQGRLLARAAGAVAPGGLLVFAVCSFAPEEGPGVVRKFLETGAPYRPSAAVGNALEALAASGLAPLKSLALDPWGGLLLPPSLLDSDAFYAAFLERLPS